MNSNLHLGVALAAYRNCHPCFLDWTLFLARAQGSKLAKALAAALSWSHIVQDHVWKRTLPFHALISIDVFFCKTNQDVTIPALRIL